MQNVFTVCVVHNTDSNLVISKYNVIWGCSGNAYIDYMDIDISRHIKLFSQLHAVSSTQQGRQRGPSVV